MSGWKHRGLVDWVEGNTAFISVVFSWNLADAFQQAVWYKAQGYAVRVGGPAVAMNPSYLTEVAGVGGKVDAMPHHNPDATFTSRGCIRRCPFCIVPKIEGDLVELEDWPARPIVCDNNLLACSKEHFDQVIDRLKPLEEIDFNQGLDARLLTKYHAQRLAELDTKCVRLAWDDTRMEQKFMRAFETLIDAGIRANKIRVYVLIGFNDTPEDALYRLETVYKLGAWPNPMRYQPLDAKRKNEHVDLNWTDAKLQRYMRYWSRLAWLEHIPFSEYKHSGRKSLETSEDQMAFDFV